MKTCIFLHQLQCILSVVQTKQIIAGGFQVADATDNYRIQVTFNHTDFQNAGIKKYFEDINGQQFSAYDKDHDLNAGLVQYW